MINKEAEKGLYFSGLEEMAWGAGGGKRLVDVKRVLSRFNWEGLGANCPWKIWQLRSCVWKTLWKALWGTGIFHFPLPSSCSSSDMFSLHLIPYPTTHPRQRTPPSSPLPLINLLFFPAASLIKEGQRETPENVSWRQDSTRSRTQRSGDLREWSFLTVSW